MVHALQETWRLLKPGGELINILPDPEGYFYEVQHKGEIHFSERKRESWSEDVLRAEAAIEEVIDHGLFEIEQEDEFEFLTYGASVSEVRGYWEEQNAYEVEPKAEDALAREEYLYTRAEEIMEELGAGAEFVIRERVKIELLRPLK